MRLARRLTIWLLLAIGGVFAADTYLTGRLYADLYDADVRRDHRVLGRALSLAVATAWRDHGEAYALALVDKTNERESQVHIRWVDIAAAPGAPNGPAVAAVDLRALGQLQLLNAEAEADGERTLYTYVPVRMDAELHGALELSDSLADARAYLRSRARIKLASLVSMALLFGLGAWLGGVGLVGRPVERLVAKARRIGSGDFSEPLELRGRDELSELAGEINAMAERLQAADRSLRAETAARLDTLEQLRHAERLTTVGKLASGLAHELGTPLNVVSGRAKMILGGETASEGETRQLARIIVEQSERMASIVRQLLDFARRRPARRESADLVQLARETASLLRPLAAKRRIALRDPGRSDPLRAEVDAPRVQQALTNLLLNAIQACREGGTVGIEIDEGTEKDPHARSGSPAPCARLAVVDDGHGIPAERLSDVFDPFFTTKEVGQGTGLGLSVAYGIVAEHGGWIEAESEPGRGSRFTLHVPLGGGGGPSHPDRR
jgi:signal transduction histidine kinase